MKRCNRCAGRLEVIDGLQPTGHSDTCPYVKGAKTKEDILNIVNNIQFIDRTFRLLVKGDGYLLQVQYIEADIDTNKPELQSARKWYISPWMTETEIVETAFVACLRSMEHVTREHFLYKTRRVYSPHINIDDRINLSTHNLPDRRPDREA